MAHPAFAWLGVGAVAYLLTFEAQRRWLLLGLAACGLVATGLRIRFLFHGLCAYMSPGPARWTALAIITAVGLMEQAPLMLMVGMASNKRPRLLRVRQHVVFWFAPAWMLGEQLWMWTGQLPINGVLLTHYQVRPVLHLLAWIGYYPTLLLMLTFAAVLAIAIKQRRWYVFAGCLILMQATWLVPARRTSIEALRGVAAIRVDRPNETIPVIEGATLVLWPEGAVPRRIAVAQEGDVQGVRIAEPMQRNGVAVAGVEHVIGIFNRANGRLQNTSVIVEPNGDVRWLRAKHKLFPIGERRFLGMMATPFDEELAPGDYSPVAHIAGRTVGILICNEMLDRNSVTEATPDDVELLLMLAGDSMIGKSAEGQDLMVAVAALTAAERGVAIARASWRGVAVLIGPDGTVLARSDSGHLQHAMLP